MNTNSKCLVCCSNFYDKALLSLKNMPSSAQEFPELDELKQDKGADLDVFQCSSCGLIQLDINPVTYYKKVIRASGFSNEMTEFRFKQFKTWIKKYNLTSKKILEVGCGKGEYLRILSNSGVKAFGIEYSMSSVNYCKQKGLSVKQGFFGDEELLLEENQYDGFMCLSFMEHWPKPNKVLAALCQNLSDGAIGLIEVPNFDMILEKGLYSEFISDHLMYFTEDTLKSTLHLNGFEVLESKPIWHNYILSAVVRKRVRTDLDFMKGLRSKVKSDIDNFISSTKINKVAIWGAGHQALATISLTNIENFIEYIVDSAVFKQGRYSPASHIPIVSEDELTKNPVDAVIIMAGSYSEEIQKILERNYPQIQVAVLRDYGLELVK
jgi:2-polyprenyl-3-methyl-5-hydroxy-6-metoxy-1,4-benzoquinol methylase